MSENLKMDIDKNMNRPIDANVINVIITIKDSEKTLDPNQKIPPSFFTGKNQYRVSIY